MRQIGQKTFSQADQAFFARLSGDVNPMHMDPVAARRLLTGRQIVHGVHTLLLALEHWFATTGAAASTVRCSFDNPVNVGDTVTFVEEADTGGGVCLRALVDGMVCADIRIAGAGDPAASATLPPNDAETDSEDVTALAAPLDRPATSHIGKHYSVEPVDIDCSSRLPHLYRRLGNHRVAAVASLSYFVGMVCPGLHSIFAGLAIDLAPASAAPSRPTFHVNGYDKRVGLFDIRFDGPLRGSIRAFLRPAPQAQPAVDEVAAHVPADEFKGTRSLIIGGSRGLGELTAKIVAAGGGDVDLTYAAGQAEAERIAEEINRFGRSRCVARKLDLERDDFAAIDLAWDSLDAVFYFATPRIFRKRTQTFETALFEEFRRYYVDRFYALCLHLESQAAARKVKVYFPSTVYIDERPRGMAEYAMAKVAAEVLIQEINRTFANVSVTADRLPRLSTDQTTSILKTSNAANLETLLPLVRSFMRS